ncbi:MAG: hypothetical protein U0175_32610 [Caldilineaceae bacterium]
MAERAGSTCPPASKDADGYLQKICVSLRANGLDVSPGKPSQYEIVAREEMVMNGRSVIQLRLNCCYMGDLAYIDKITGTVIDFQAGRSRF